MLKRNFCILKRTLLLNYCGFLKAVFGQNMGISQFSTPPGYSLFTRSGKNLWDQQDRICYRTDVIPATQPSVSLSEYHGDLTVD